MRMITAVKIFFIMTVGAQLIDSSVSKTRQKRSWVVDIFTMKRGFKGFLGYLTFYDNIQECKIYGPGITEAPQGLFLIDKKNRTIIVTEGFDYDDRKQFTLVFECKALQHMYKRLGVDIEIEEVYEPYFSKGIYVIDAEESMQQGTTLLTMQASNITNENLAFNIRVTPNPHKLIFVINEKREISFRGCLDYEENKKYTVVVEATDQKKVSPRSSTAIVIINIIDKNDQKPVITKRTGSGWVKENESGVEVYRIQVSDNDSPGSLAWRAKFSLNGEKSENFKMEVNPNTNEGILSILKPLDYEDIPEVNLMVQLENEEPFFSCSVQKMYYDGQLCEVEFSTNGSSLAMLSFTITVENVNEPPDFTDAVKHVTVMENTPPGHSLWTFTAKDPDQNPPNRHRFIKGKDVDNWVTIDSKTGSVSTAKVLDRESPFVKNSTYTVMLHAVDDGTPMQTGTGTLIIHLSDENDNAPLLKDNKVMICLPESKTNITTVDPDLPPFSAPFTYEVQDDKGKWRIEPSNGETATLIKDISVYSGSYELHLIITDSGGLSSRQKLSITVYNCSRDVGSYSIHAAASGILVMVLCLLLMLCILIMVVKCSCSSHMAEKSLFLEAGYSKGFICSYNDEGPGTDAEVPPCPPYHTPENNIKIWNHLNREIILNNMLKSVTETKLRSLQEQEKLCDYQPHPYYDEGEPGELAELESITVSESQLTLDDLQNLNPKFQHLAEICRPDLMQQCYVSQTSIVSDYYQQHQLTSF